MWQCPGVLVMRFGGTIPFCVASTRCMHTRPKTLTALTLTLTLALAPLHLRERHRSTVVQVRDSWAECDPAGRARSPGLCAKHDNGGCPGWGARIAVFWGGRGGGCMRQGAGVWG